VLVTNAASLSDEELVQRARRAVLPEERDAVGEVGDDRVIEVAGAGPHIVVIDCGVKRNIIRSLVRRGARVTVVPYRTPYADVIGLQPDGVVISPGPGDPANLDDGLDIVHGVLRDELPFFGICLGHQLLARALGAQTTKLKFGHRGGNHPVQDADTGIVTITSQNHGFQVKGESLPTGGDWRVAFRNLNDGSVEGLAHDRLPFMSVQFHPEAAPGPWDNDLLFDRFLAEVESARAGADSRSGGAKADRS
jgi:carbamoyl-phosphate synthase small subunit